MKDYAEKEAQVEEQVVEESSTSVEDASASHPPQLYAFCEDEKLKNDAMFIDKLGDLLSSESNT